MASAIYVRIARPGSQVKQVCLNGERTLEAALRIAQIPLSDLEKCSVTANGKAISKSTTLNDGDSILITNKHAGSGI